ncbi:MAG TPA: trypsin-like peptidase domain-containing protein [Acidimicrobiales bacterium]|nr:trypsin-like peptidase domain-containing protein [Acidimicrobiales bacterium]
MPSAPLSAPPAPPPPPPPDSPANPAPYGNAVPVYPSSYPVYGPPAGGVGYPGYGGYGPPGGAYPYGYPPPLPAPRLVRHTLTRRNWLLVVIVTAVLAAAVGAVIGAAVGIGSQQTIVKQYFPNQSVLPQAKDVQAILAAVEPAVVSIDSQSSQSGGSSGDFVQAAGTGMILTPQGEVLTNDHVVAGATTVTVTLFGQTKQLSAHVVGTDPGNDLALVQIDTASNLPTVTLGDSAHSQVGDSVLAIGNALALAGGPTVTEGIVSAVNRSLSAQNDAGQTENLSGLLQTDAAINPGNSGGPLVNAQAQVIGMNTAVASSSSGNAPAQNIGFAIPIDLVKPRLAELQRGGPGGAGNASPQPTPVANSAFMGVSVGTVTPALQQLDHLTPSSGALVLSVQSGSPADKAGIQTNDVIVSFNGTAIQTADNLTAAIHPLKPGDHVSVGIYRGATRTTINVTLGANPSAG